jgi:hypothetical protein
MSEETWAQGREWDRERGETEIKRQWQHKGDEVCSLRGCRNRAQDVYLIGDVDRPYGSEVYLCWEHSSEDTAMTVHAGDL